MPYGKPNRDQGMKAFNLEWEQTFMVELDSMERMLIQMELTVMAGDHESYKISKKQKEPVCKF